jgi:hypothetical protein
MPTDGDQSIFLLVPKVAALGMPAQWGNSVARPGHAGCNLCVKNSVDMLIRFGMGVPMNSNPTHSPTKRAPADRPEFPSLPEKRHEPESAAPRKWQNLTLDELQTWMDEANSR